MDHEFVAISGGIFQMGSDIRDTSGASLHTVEISDFEIGKYEITNAQYCEFLNSGEFSKQQAEAWLYTEHSKIVNTNARYIPAPGYEDHPVVVVSWDGANAYATWKDARLPTEAEWEYAARGGKLSEGFTYSGSNQVSEVAWFGGNANNSTHPVGYKMPNELGVYDMSGNVWEWCSDWFGEDYYNSSPRLNPRGPNQGEEKVLRGGGYLFDELFCRVYNRYHISPNARNTRIGFRIARSLSKT